MLRYWGGGGGTTITIHVVLTVLIMKVVFSIEKSDKMTDVK